MLRDKFLLWGEQLLEKDPWFLAPLSWLWGFAAFCKNALYDLHFLPTHRIPCTVVSIGNLVAGGTGKTPFVHLLASQFLHRKVAILSSGYGMDEPLLLQRRLPHARIYVGKDRVSMARKAFEEGAELILLDDGFQYRKLYRDFDLVLVSRKDLTGHYLPRGFLRDSPKRLKYAEAVFVAGEDFEVMPGRVLDLQGREVSLPQSVGLFCGIAGPARFQKTVADQGATIVDTWFYADHGVPHLSRLHSYAKKCKSLGASALLCTEKDVVKFSSSFQTSLPIYFLEISHRMKNFALLEKLVAKINQTIDTSDV